MEVIIENSKPSVEDFIKMRRQVGWGETDPQLANVALNNSLFHVVAKNNENIIGMARVVGDGAMFFYIQDLVVIPSYQNKGVGDLLMQNIELYLSSVSVKGSTIGLLSSKGKEAFYSRYGYTERNGSSLGFGMCKFI